MGTIIKKNTLKKEDKMMILNLSWLVISVSGLLFSYDFEGDGGNDFIAIISLFSGIFAYINLNKYL